MNLGMPEMIFIFFMALVVFGPKKLPELARQLGKVMAEFKRASNEFKYQLESEITTAEIQENQAKRQELTQTILPPEHPLGVEHTSERTAERGPEYIPEPSTVSAPAPEVTPGLSKEPNA
jgi:sec-independent protein translocase protein TatB